ncbi:MAG: dephospho-CoA kinase [Balneolales bacterium]
MITVGITGGIGSGKSTVCKQWERLGAKVIYADQLAKELMVNNPYLRDAIKKEFGDESYLNDGSLNKPYLSHQAFEGHKVDMLNKLVHPEVYKETQRINAKAEKEGVKILVKEAALLLQNGRPSNIDFIILVLANEELRKKRVALRDKTSINDVEARIKKQQNFSELIHLADFILENDGSLQDLIHKANDLYNVLLNKAIN